MKRSFLLRSATLGLLLSAGHLILPLLSISVTASPAPISRMSWPQSCAAIAPPGQPTEKLPRLREIRFGAILYPLLYSQQYQAALDWLQALSGEQKQQVNADIELVQRQILRQGTPADRAALRTFILAWVQATEPDSRQRLHRLNWLIMPFLRTGQFEDAIALSQDLLKLAELGLTRSEQNSNEFYQWKTTVWNEVRALALAFHQVGQVAIALDIIDRIPTAASFDGLSQRLEVRLTMAERYQEQGKPELAEPLLVQAAQLAPQVNDPLLLLELAERWQSQPEQAQRWVSAAVPLMQSQLEISGGTPADLLPTLARQQRRVGLTQEANQTLKAVLTYVQQELRQDLTRDSDVPFLEVNQQNILDLHQALLEANQLETAQQLLTQVLRQAKNPESLQSDVIKQYAALGQFDRALQLFNQLSNQDIRKITLLGVVPTILAAQQYDQAIELINRWPESGTRQFLTALVVQQYLQDGQPEKASQLVRQSASYEVIQRVLDSALAQSQPQQADWAFNQATQAIKGMTGPRQQEEIYNLASLYATALQFDRAVQVRGMLQDKTRQQQLDDDISEKVISQMYTAIAPQQENQAIQFVTTLPESSLKARGLLSLVAYYVMTGQKAAALPWLEQVTAMAQGDRPMLEQITLYYWQLGEYAQALKVAQTEQALANHRDGLLQRIELATLAGETALARQLLLPLQQQAEQSATSESQAREQVNLLSLVAERYIDLGDLNQGRSLLQRAVQLQQSPVLRQQRQDQREGALIQLALVHARLAHRYAAAGQRDQATAVVRVGRSLTTDLSIKAQSASANHLLQCVQTAYGLTL